MNPLRGNIHLCLIHNTDMESRRSALIGILLVGFIPSISVIFGIKILEDELSSQVFFILCKIMIFVIPTIWYIKIDKNPISIIFPSNEGIKFGIITGIAMSLIICVTWIIFENSIDIIYMVDTLDAKGLSDPKIYFAGMIYWIFINSLLEEYVFRWFITTKSSILFNNDNAGIIFSALLFTLHHTLALHYFGFLWWQTFLASIGLLSAAAIWSMLYLKYRSIWVCWISHAICDIVVFYIGYYILFQ